MVVAAAGARREELTRLVTAAKPVPCWLDQPGAPPARAALRGDVACDLAVIGGGFSGLWAALLIRRRGCNYVIRVMTPTGPSWETFSIMFPSRGKRRSDGDSCAR